MSFLFIIIILSEELKIISHSFTETNTSTIISESMHSAKRECFYICILRQPKLAMNILRYEMGTPYPYGICIMQYKQIAVVLWLHDSPVSWVMFIVSLYLKKSPWAMVMMSFNMSCEFEKKKYVINLSSSSYILLLTINLPSVLQSRLEPSNKKINSVMIL